jgi:uncharacterized protein (TIGR02246 family)
MAVGAALATIACLYWSPARQPAARAAEKKADDAGDASPAIAAVRKTAEEYARAFNKHDARALAALWTKDAEYVGPDNEPVRGREAIEKVYLAFFKENPKTRAEVQIDSLRLLGTHTALEEGTLKVRLKDEKEPGVTRYSVLHVREGNAWRMASVREWIPDPSELITLKDIEWLIGEWTAEANGIEVRTRYAWDEDHAYIHCRYVVKKGEKVTLSGTQIIGKDPTGGLRAWVFDKSGTIGESTWTRDEGRWVMEAKGTLPDGSEVTAVNIMIPLDKDAFTWRSVKRTAGGVELPDQPLLKVTRVKEEK